MSNPKPANSALSISHLDLASDRPRRAAVERQRGGVLHRATGGRRGKFVQPIKTRRTGEGRRTRRGGGTISQAPVLNWRWGWKESELSGLWSH